MALQKKTAPRIFPAGRHKTPRDYLLWLISDGGITIRRAGDLLQVGERTIRRWCAEGDQPPPWAALEALRSVIAHGEHEID